MPEIVAANRMVLFSARFAKQEETHTLGSTSVGAGQEWLFTAWASFGKMVDSHLTLCNKHLIIPTAWEISRNSHALKGYCGMLAILSKLDQVVDSGTASRARLRGPDTAGRSEHSSFAASGGPSPIHNSERRESNG